MWRFSPATSPPAARPRSIRCSGSIDYFETEQKNVRDGTLIVGRYQFDRDTWRKGLAVGSAYRWRTTPTIGFLRTGTVLDPTRPIHGRGTTNLGAWLDYERALTFGVKKFRWSAQLRVPNVFDDRTVLPWTADDDGSGQPYIQSRRPSGARMFAFSSSIGF